MPLSLLRSDALKLSNTFPDLFGVTTNGHAKNRLNSKKRAKTHGQINSGDEDQMVCAYLTYVFVLLYFTFWLY